MATCGNHKRAFSKRMPNISTQRAFAKTDCGYLCDKRAHDRVLFKKTYLAYLFCPKNVPSFFKK